MAASGYTPIILFNSTTTGNTPTTSNLAVGELAINVTDGKLFFNQSGTIKVLANATYATSVSTISFGTTGLTPSTATNGVVTVAGTLATTNGGTGLTSFTANGVVYASSTSALTTGSAFTFDGTILRTTTSGLYPLISIVSSGTSAIFGYQLNNTGTGGQDWRVEQGRSAVGELNFTNSTASNLVVLKLGTSGVATFSNAVIASQFIPTSSGIPTNGMYLPATNTLGFATNSTEVARFTSGGAFVIGNTATSYNMQIYAGGAVSSILQFATGTTGAGAANGLTVGLNSSGNAVFIHQQAYSLLFGTSGATTLVLDTSGNLGLGVTPSAWGTSGSAYKAFQFGVSGALYGRTSNETAGLSSGVYFDNVGAKYLLSGNTASLYNQASGQHVWYSAPSGTAGNAITFTQVLSVNLNQTLALQGGTSTVGTGIAFPATQSASSNANTLDDYEEGTWTPTFGYSVTNPTVTGYSAQTGWYIKIGRLVTVYCDVEASSISGGSGNAFIFGLPFSSASAGRNYPVPTFRDCTAVASGGANTMICGFVDNNANYIYLQFNGINGAYGTTGSPAWNSSGRVTLSVAYYAAN